MKHNDFDEIEEELLLDQMDEQFLDDEMTQEEEDQNIVYEYIIDEAIVALGLDEEDTLDYTLLQNRICQMLSDLAEGTDCLTAVAKLRASFICAGFDFDIDDLEEFASVVKTKCAKHVLAVKMAQQSFENGATSDTILPQIVDFLA